MAILTIEPEQSRAHIEQQFRSLSNVYNLSAVSVKMMHLSVSFCALGAAQAFPQSSHLDGIGHKCSL